MAWFIAVLAISLVVEVTRAAETCHREDIICKVNANYDRIYDRTKRERVEGTGVLAAAKRTTGLVPGQDEVLSESDLEALVVQQRKEADPYGRWGNPGQFYDWRGFWPRVVDMRRK